MIFTCFIPTTTKAAGNHTLETGYYPGYSYQFQTPTGYTAWGDGFWGSVNGKAVFCVDPKTAIQGGSGYTISDFTNSQVHQMSLIAYYGWTKHAGASDAVNWRLATQYMIWEQMGYTPISITGFNYDTYKAQIQSAVNRHSLKPSFHDGNYEVNVNESITLTDTNGVLSEFAEVSSQNGVNVVRNGNSITLTPTDSAPEKIKLNFAKVPNNCTGVSIVYQKAGAQDVAEFYVQDPTRIYINLQVNKEGSLKIAKQDEEGNYVPNTSFALSYNSDMSDPIGTYKTGSDGTVQIDGLLPKDLYVQETNVPANLVLDSKIYKVTIIANDVVSFNAKNAIQKGNITLKKQDADTGSTAQGDATLAGAVYGLYARENIANPISGKLYHAKDTLVAQTTTDPLGNTAGFLNQNLGAYYIQEIQAPTGYQLDPNKYNVDLTYGGQTVSIVTQNMTVSDQVITGKIEIHKYSDEETSVLEPEPNAEFTVILKKYVDRYGSFEEALKHLASYSKKEYAILKTDKTGYASSGELAAGDYVMKQTKTPHVDLIPMEGSLEFTISTQDQSFHYAIKNEWKKAYLRLVKLDAQSEEPITLSNASFKIWNVKKQQYVKQKVGEDWIDTFTTNKKGQVTLPLMLLAGEYEAREITAPNGYLIDTDPIPFTITGSIMEADDDGDPLIIVRVKDEKPTAEIHIEKADEETKELLSGVQYQL
uniref:SpaA isopeptide-forming pilin-related protein n=1 Tax=Massilicoli timonensis TaxID=2015901 RepID=UPI003AAD7882